MSATNKTAVYELPIFLGTDVPSWLTDWNGAMGDIDTAIAAAKAAADAAASTAGTAATDIVTINGQITSLQNTVGTHTTQIGTISGNINTINSLIGNGTPTTTDQTLIGAINELHANQGDLADLTTTDKSSLVAAINEAAQSGGSPIVIDFTNTSLPNTTTTQEFLQMLAEKEYPIWDAIEQVSSWDSSGAVTPSVSGGELTIQSTANCWCLVQIPVGATSLTYNLASVTGPSVINLGYCDGTGTFIANFAEPCVVGSEQSVPIASGAYGKYLMISYAPGPTLEAVFASLKIQ